MKFKLKNKFKNIYKIFPVFFAFIFICFISVLLLNIKDDEAKILDTPEFLVSSINDFSSLKKTNEISFLMKDYKYYENNSDVLKVSDGYIISKIQKDDNLFYTYIIKMDYSGNELWSYKYECSNHEYRNNMVLLGDKVYFSSPSYGTFVLNVFDGTLYKSNTSIKSFDIQLYNENLVLINYDSVTIVDFELNVLDEFESDLLSNNDFKVFFDDFYIEDENIYVLSTKESFLDGTFQPIIYALDDKLDYISELPIKYDENQGYLSDNGYYYDYFNFIKDGENFYQIGYDLHKIDKDGNDTILIDSGSFYNHKVKGIFDVLVFNDFYITLEVEGEFLEDDRNSKEFHVYFNIYNKDFEIVKQYKLNDNFNQFYSMPESMNLVNGSIVVKWYDRVSYEVYISEFEFSNEDDMCTVVSGTGSDIGDEIKCGEEEFYVLENDGVNVKMMGKYNLLVGSNYEKFLLDEPYETDNYIELEEYILSLPSIREKLENGYVLGNPIYYVNETDGKYILEGVLISKSLDYKSGTVFCESSFECTEDELLQLAKEKGYFGEQTSYYFMTSPSSNNYIAISFSPYFSTTYFYSYYLFNEPVDSVSDALANNIVREKLEESTDFGFITLEDGSIFGISLYKDTYDNSKYKYVYLDEPVSTFKELLQIPEVADYLTSGYVYSYGIQDGDEYIAIRLEYIDENLKSIILNNEYNTSDEVFRSDELKTYLDEGYLYSSSIYDDDSGVYIGAQLYKYSNLTYKTILFDTARLSTKEIYEREDVKSYLEQGYYLKKIYYVSSSKYYCVSNSFCRQDVNGILLEKDVQYDYVTVFLDEPVLSSSAVAEQEVILDKIAEGYSFYDSDYYRYHITETAEDGTTSSSMKSAYFVGILRKKTGVSVSTKSDYVPYIMNRLHPVIVRQDETALGAHGGVTGAPEPFEIGIVEPMLIWGAPISFPYSLGFMDYDYYPDSSAYKHFNSYYNTLKVDGFNVLDVNSITVSEINELVRKVTGSELPLEEWYMNPGGASYDPVLGSEFYILGSIKELMPEGYEWLWNTTYWTRTTTASARPSGGIEFDDLEIPSSMGDYIYFIDTLGDLCASHYCTGVIGAGLRPVVTMSLSSIEFNVTTSTDGNGVVNSSHVSATSGDIITFNVTPNEGYILESITVTDELGNSVVYTDYKFTMPAADVNIDAKFQEKIYFEPEIRIKSYSIYNNLVGEEYYFSVYISNPYSFPLTDIKIVTNGSNFDSWFEFWSFSENVATLDYLEPGSSSHFEISFDVTELGSKVATAEIVSASAEEPYFFNEEKDYIATLEAFTTAGLEICNVLDGEGNGSINQYQLYGYEIDGYDEFSTSVTLEDNSCTKIAIPTGYEYELLQIDKMEYEFVKVTGHITSKWELFEVEPEKYKITFYNKYNKKGYFHSWDRKENDILVDRWLA